MVVYLIIGVIIIAKFTMYGGILMGNSSLNFEKLLMNAVDKCSGKYVPDIGRDFQLLYPFTTENIGGYIDYFNLSNKTLLTVGSSGDQIINGSLFDCSDIVCLDICDYAKYYIYLKMSCLLELDRDEFLTFLCYKGYPTTFENNDLAFSNGVYKKLSQL